MTLNEKEYHNRQRVVSRNKLRSSFRS